MRTTLYRVINYEFTIDTNNVFFPTLVAKKSVTLCVKLSQVINASMNIN